MGRALQGNSIDPIGVVGFMIGRLPGVVLFSLICLFCWHSFARGSETSESNSSARAVMVESVNVNQRSDGLAIEIDVSAPVVPTSGRLPNPDRLVFDFLNCELQGGNRKIPVKGGPVQVLRLSRFRIRPPVTRLVIESTEPLDFQVKPAEKKVIIEIAFPKTTSIPAASGSQPEPGEKVELASSTIARKQSGQHNAPLPAKSRPSAYGIEARARDLTVEDLQTLEDKSNAGDPEAETMLALAYHTGNLLKRNDAEALRLLRKAAEQGFMAAQESLGIFLETGIGMEHPAPAEALEWYKKAVRQGSLDAATNIGLMYAEGKGVPRDPALALTWIRKAADGGDAAAQYNLALMYARGNGVAKDYKESLRWLMAAADQNVVPALVDLGIFYMHPPDATPADVDRAIGYYEKAADLGSSRAAAVLGNIFARGPQGKPDYEQSVKWYRKAAEQGERDGQWGLAMRYAMGQGVPVDLQEARRLFTAAADQGQAEAQFDLALICEEGKDAPADRSLAEHYYGLAAEQGLPKAQFRLGKLLASTAQSASDRIAAYRWLTLSQTAIPESAAALSNLKTSMSEQEIVDADREVTSWRTAHQANHQ
ncbi:MAG: AMIN domain-containing protein [Terriglobales bacterium]